MKPGTPRLSALVVAVLAAGLLAGCATAQGAATGEGTPGPTGATIERTYTLLAGSPYQVTVGSAAATTLYDSLRDLPRDNGDHVCPGDAGAHYTITINQGSKVVEKATAIIGGCRVVLIGGHSYGGGSSSSEKSFWSTLLAAVGQNAGVQQSPPAA
jgi:hypothetical protein